MIFAQIDDFPNFLWHHVILLIFGGFFTFLADFAHLAGFMAQWHQNRPQGDFKGFQRGQAPLAAHAEALMRRLVRIGDVGAYTYESAHQCLSVGSSEGWVVG